MESIDQKFYEIDKLISTYRSSDLSCEGEVERQGNRAVKIVSGLTDIIKNGSLTNESQLGKRICKIVDDINKDDRGMSIWDFSCTYGDKSNEPLMSFLKELAIRKFIPQIDKIFRCDYLGGLPLVSLLSSGISKEKFMEEVFILLPQEYRDRLSKERIGLDPADENSPMAHCYPKLIGWCHD